MLKLVLMIAVSGVWLIQPEAGENRQQTIDDAVQERPESPTEKPSRAAGMQIREYQDPRRPAWIGEGARPLSTTVWYPSNDVEDLKQLELPRGNPLFDGGVVAIGGQFDPGPKRGLVLLSHGTGGSALQVMWLGRALAERGYIVAAVNHHGNTASEAQYDARGFRMPWERARDISGVLDNLLADPLFGSAIDQARIFAGGFSLGGYTTIALAGGRTDLQHFDRFCASDLRDATCKPQAEYPLAEQDFETILGSDEATRESVRSSGDDFSDPRIKAFFVIAPALAQAFTDESLRAITQRVLIIEGDLDNIAPAGTNARWLHEHLPASDISQIEGAGHFTFAAVCTELGQATLPICQEAEPIADREQFHSQAVQLVVSFLQKR